MNRTKLVSLLNTFQNHWNSKLYVHNLCVSVFCFMVFCPFPINIQKKTCWFYQFFILDLNTWDIFWNFGLVLYPFSGSHLFQPSFSPFISGIFLSLIVLFISNSLEQNLEESTLCFGYQTHYIFLMILFNTYQNESDYLL